MDNRKPKSVKELLNQDNYIVPIYQRNYAWEKKEIDQLIDDITFARENNLKDYFIGTLVTFDKGNNIYEIIDGQQRHTTLSLIHAVLIHHFEIGAEINEHFNLTYQARPESIDFFNNLHVDFKFQIRGNNNLAYAIRQIIIPKLELLEVKGKSGNLEKWAYYFYNHVKFFRVEVPEGTDLHHYFETMNNRGQQLEEHEVLKAKFLAQLKDSKIESNEFSRIWDGCSNFSEYYIPSTFEDIQIDNIGIDDVILGLGGEDISLDLDKEVETIENSNYSSIIDFSNFLLMVLKIYKITTDEDIPLNDKNLLSSFGYFKESFSIDAIEFSSLLKKCRLLFDKYFIKRSYQESTPYWVILNYKGSDDRKSTFTNRDDEYDDEFIQGMELQSKIVKIQSMLQSVYFTNNYKNWLFEALIIVNESSESSPVDVGNAILAKLEDFALLKFKEEINEETFLPKDSGLGIQRIVFYYIDYLLWKTYFDNLRGKEKVEDSILEMVPLSKKINFYKDIFSRFTFKSYSSIEHFFPRNHTDDLKLYQMDVIDNFGNLCLISRSMNSKYSNLNIPAKRKHFIDKKEKESLKQVMMFDYGDDFNSTDILAHEDEMKHFIKYHLSVDNSLDMI